MKAAVAALSVLSLSFIPALASAQAEAFFSEQELTVAETLREQALASDRAFEITADLTTRIGHRLAGSPNDARGVAWAIDMLESLEFDRVWTEPVTFPNWTRNRERVQVLAPYEKELVATALGFSPATPEDGIEAEVIMLDDLAVLEAAEPAEVQGKIVFIRNRMQRARDGSGYGPAVRARSVGSMIAAEKGAAALVIRSIGTSTNRFAHTGGMRFDTSSRSLPAAAISNPDADQLERLVALGEPVRLRLLIDAQINEPYTSQNVLAQIDGAKYPEKIVALGAHLDSWDVGTGALDDAAGVGIVTNALKLIQDLEHRPDRSIQVILFAAEEIGLWGGRAWAEEHRDTIEHYQLAAESDFGTGPVYEINARVTDRAWPVIQAIQAQLEPLGIALGGRSASAGPDFLPMLPYGLVAIDLEQDGTNYFDYHHTENDTLDKVDPEALKQNTAAYAMLAWLAAQSPMDFGSGAELLAQESSE